MRSIMTVMRAMFGGAPDPMHLIICVMRAMFEGQQTRYGQS